TKHNRNRDAAAQVRRAPHRKTEEEQGSEGRPDAMTRHIHDSMESEEKRGDESGNAKTLIRSFAQRKDAPDEQGDPGNSQHHRRPAGFHPMPEPIALRMNGSGAGQRNVAKDREHFIEISEPNSAPRRRADEVNSIPKDCPAQIGCDAGIAGPQVKALESLAAEEQHYRKQN